LPWFQRAHEIAGACGEEALAIDALHMLAIAAPAEDQLDWNRQALAKAEGSEDPAARVWLGPILNNIGWTHHDRGEFELALAAFERALQIRRERGQIAETRIAEWCVARAMRSLGRIDEALAIQRRLAAELVAAGEHDPYVDEEIAECLAALAGRPESPGNEGS
jgi:tetratricopeptide (TPR) repeat protein